MTNFDGFAAFLARGRVDEPQLFMTKNKAATRAVLPAASPHSEGPRPSLPHEPTVSERIQNALTGVGELESRLIHLHETVIGPYEPEIWPQGSTLETTDAELTARISRAVGIAMTLCED